MSYVIHFSPLKFLLKIILFFFLFSYLFPIEFTFLPIGTARIVQLIGFVYFVFTLINRRLPSPVYIYWFCAIIITCVAFYSTSIFNQVNDFSVIKIRGIYIFLYTISAYLIVSLIKKTSNNNPFYSLIEWMVLASAIYAIISFALFFNHDLFEIYKNIIAADEDLYNKNSSLMKVRLIGLSNYVQYSNAACYYGIVMWAAIFAFKSRQTFLYNHKWLFYLVISLFVIAGIFSGRTFFIILLMTILYLFLLNNSSFLRTIKEFISMFSPVIILLILVVSYIIANNPEAMEWAFELFINMQDGNVRSDSTDVLKTMLTILPDNPYTWLVGDGRFDNGDGTYYMNTDSGYLRSLFYWGLIGSFIYYIILYVFYYVLKKISLIPKVNVYFLLILLLTYIYQIKETFLPLSFFILYLMALIEFPKRHIKT